MIVTLQQGLDRLEDALQHQGTMVSQAIQNAVLTLSTRDINRAQVLIAFDDEIDANYLEIEEGLHTLLARQTPVASDLRLAIAILHVNVHLERMADYCVTIAKLTELAASLPSEESIVADFGQMGRQADQMLEVALHSFADRDLAQAESLVDLDARINRANHRIIEKLLALGAKPEAREWGLRMLLVSRCLERIGDHAVDIGERIGYLITGQVREFTDASDYVRSLKG